MNELPDGWVAATIADLILEGGLLSDGDWVETKDQDPNGSIRLLQLADIGDGQFIDKSNRFINDEQFLRLRCTELLKNDVLVARMPDPLGRACLMPDLAQKCVTVVDIAIIRPCKKTVLPKYLMHLINSPKVRGEIDIRATGTTRRRISKGNLIQLELPIAPPAEQKQIADKLDALLARVDACRERLDKVEKIIKRFRQSVISAAINGDLTKGWRQRNNLPIDGWGNKRLQDVCASITDGDHQAPPIAEEGIPFITISAINSGKLKLEKATRFVPKAYYDSLKETRRPQLGDVLFSVTGSIGIPAIVDTDDRFVFQRHIAILKVHSGRILTDYLNILLGTEEIRKQALEVATGTAQLTIPLTGLRNFDIRVPTLDEQKEIMRRVAILFSYADRLEGRCQVARNKFSKLTPAILAKAFRGELVQQYPGDKPSSVLLRPIRDIGENIDVQPKRRSSSKRG